MTGNISFLIVVTGYNCAHFVDKCIRSIQSQTYTNYRIVVINDGSTDYTLRMLEQYHIEIINNSTNLGAAYSRYVAIHANAKPDDVILLLGLDDELKPDCLETVVKQYEQGKWMTYGNWIDQHDNGLPENFKLDFDKITHKKRDYRKVTYRSTAPNTFYAKLFFKIPESDFKLNDKWIDTTTESEVMFSCLEMCGEKRIGVIHKYIYLYNRDLPNGTLRRLGLNYKYSIYGQIIKRPRKPLYENI